MKNIIKNTLLSLVLLTMVSAVANASQKPCLKEDWSFNICPDLLKKANTTDAFFYCAGLLTPPLARVCAKHVADAVRRSVTQKLIGAVKCTVIKPSLYLMTGGLVCTGGASLYTNKPPMVAMTECKKAGLEWIEKIFPQKK
jgi:hypothetical protein